MPQKLGLRDYAAGGLPLHGVDLHQPVQEIPPVKERVRSDALVQTMHAVPVRVAEHAAHAIGRDPRVSGVGAIHGNTNRGDGGAVCSLDVSPGHYGNDEGDEACADAPPAGIGLAMQPRPEFDPDVGGAHE